MGVIDGIEAEARTIATDGPESDGTLAWQETTIVLARVRAGDETGVGYTYADRSVAELIEGKLGPAVMGRDAMATAACWHAMHAALRNAGQAGAGAMAVSAVDLALHDLKARLLGAPIAQLLGRARDAVPIYASGGFCSWDEGRLREWCAARAGAGAGKVKGGRERGKDQGGARAGARRRAPRRGPRRRARRRAHGRRQRRLRDGRRGRA